MITIEKFAYEPFDHEAEKASNSYLMSVIAIMAGLPLPIINLIATYIFFMANRNGTYFVRWHCTQAVLSQVFVVIFNSGAVFWTFSIVFGNLEISNSYIAYVVVVLFFNISEFIFTVYTATVTRKGTHVKWFFFGPLTDIICKH